MNGGAYPGTPRVRCRIRLSSRPEHWLSPTPALADLPTLLTEEPALRAVMDGSRDFARGRFGPRRAV